MQIFLLIALVVAVLAVVFALQNAIPVAVAFLGWQIDSSLALVLLAALGAGVLIGFLAMLPAQIKGGWTASVQKREIRRLEAQIAEQQAQLDKDQEQPEASESPSAVA